MTRPIGISVPHRRVEEDDDIQDYKKPWVGLTDEETNSVIDEVKESQHSFDDISFAIAIAIEKALKEKNT